MSEFSDTLDAIVDGKDLSVDDAQALMDRLMEGEFDDAQIGALLTALRVKGETPDEIAGFARSMRRHARRLELPGELRPVVDTCGTGGDSVETINISTLSALVAAGSGLPVAKHGNRSVSSQCGSADLLEALGLELDLGPDEVRDSLEETGFGFMFAPNFHASMKHAIGPRRSLGVRTVFNLLGPLTNPADADRQLVGVFGEAWVRPIARALGTLGVERAMVVHGRVGMDEISPSGPTAYAEVRDGDVEEGIIQPEDLGVDPVPVEALAGGDPGENESIARDLLAGGAAGPVESAVAINAGAVLYVGGRADTLREGVERARESIHTGRARETMEEAVRFSRRDGGAS